MLPLDRSRTNTNMDRESKSISHLTDDRLRRKTVSTAPRSVNLYADWSGHKTKVEQHLTKLTVDDRKQSNHDVKSELLATSPLHHDSHIYLYQ